MKRILFYLAGLFLVAALAVAGCRTRAARGNSTVTPVAERVVGGLQEPVALVFLSNDIMLVAERRAGRIRWVEKGMLRTAPFATIPVPSVSGYNEHGLLGLAVHPDYPRVPYVYAFHTVPDGSGRPVKQQVVRFTVRDGKGIGQRVIIDNLPISKGCCHDGGRIIFGSDGKLYVTIGDTLRPDEAQNYDSLIGKVLRYNADGSIPEDNPFEKQQTTSSQGDSVPMMATRTPVYTIGHRNPFGMAVNPDNGDIYLTENGPDRDDEINHLIAGDNYGWPESVGRTGSARFRAPLWASGHTQIAPTGAVFYTGDEFPQFRGNLLFATYNGGKLRRAIFAGPDKITSVAIITEAGSNAKLDVALSPDGTLYYSSMDAVYRLRAKE